MSDEVAELSQVTYELFHPVHLGAGGYRHPILVWGSRCLSTPAQYTGLLRHLSSFGFVVVAPSGWLGSGEQMLAAARWLIDQNDQPSSSFYGKLDTSRVGALGHCEGATDALHAALLDAGMVKGLALIDLPDRPWGSPSSGPDLTPLASPVLLVTGTLNWRSTPIEQQHYYDQVPGSAAMASLRDVDRVDLHWGGWAYIAAWMRYTVSDDPIAARAFVGESAEINANTAWEHQVQKNLR